MGLEQIRAELKAVNEGIYYGDIEFSYDAMGFSMAFSHPSEILGDMVGELDQMIEYEMADPEELELMLSGMKEMRYSFDLVALGPAIEKLEAFIKEIK